MKKIRFPLMRRMIALCRIAVSYTAELCRPNRFSVSPDGDVIKSPRAYAWDIAKHHALHKRLLDFFHQPAYPMLGAVEAANPRIRYKMFHLYRRTGLPIEQRAALLIEHYDLALELFGETVFRAAHIEPEGFVLCHVALPAGHGVLPVKLTRYLRSWREGELSLGLYDPFGTLLYTLTFSLFRATGGGGMFIGSMIGETSLDNIKHLTKLMQGLRPQALMLFLAQALCRYYSLTQLLAVGRRSHVFADTRFEERLHFDYDTFWQEQGGQPMPDDQTIYLLPVHPDRRLMTNIPSHKRAQYRRRYAFMEDAEADLRNRLGGVRPG